MGKKIDDEIIAQIPELYKKLGSKNAVAKELGISNSTVSKYLLMYQSAPIEVIKRKNTKVDEELIVKINEKYKEYKNTAQVARELNISASTVKKYLTEENLKLKERMNDDRDALWYYIFRLFGVDNDDPVSEWNVVQMMKFKKMGISYRAQLLTLKWFYEVKKNPVKEKYKTIGIIPYVFEEARAYYKAQAQRQKEIEEAIEKQLERDRIEIQYNPSDYINKRRKKKKVNLDCIDG